MSECLSDMPRYVRQRGDEWQGADHQNDPWRPISKPRGFPCTTDEPAVQNREPASVVAEATPADRMALALCSWRPVTCANPCALCRAQSAAHAHEIARQLRERHGSSATADWLDGVGCHPGTVQTVQTVQGGASG